MWQHRSLLHQAIKGGMPAGPLWETYKSILLVNGTMYRMMALPPAAPKEAVNALRQAVLRLNDDKEYIEEAERTMDDTPEYVSGPNLNDDVRKGLSVSPEIKAFMDDYIKKADVR